MEFSDFYNRIPFFTRYWLTITVGLSLLATVRFIDANKLPLDWDPIVNQREIWRPLTALFYCPPRHFFFIINNYFLYRYSEKLESREFAGRPHDYFMMLVFNWICCVVCAYWFGFHLLMSTMVMSVLTVWCQFNPHAVISTEYWNGMRFKAAYLPWAILGANLVYYHHYGYYFGIFSHGATLTPQGTEEFAGIIAGYLTHHLLTQYPTLLQAPDFVKQRFANAGRSFNTAGYSEARPGSRPQARYSAYTGTGEDYHYRSWGRRHTFEPNPLRCATEARMLYRFLNREYSHF